MKVKDLIALLQDMPQDAYVIHSGQINGDWCLVEADSDKVRLAYANHLEAFGEFILQDKQYVNSSPVVVIEND